MPKPTVLVDRVKGLDRMPAGQRVGAGHAVVYTDGGASLLDLADPRAAVWESVLDDLRAANEPVYLETDPTSNVITRLLLPQAVLVTDVAPGPVGTRHEVELEVSSARHHLDTTAPDYPQLLQALTVARQQGTGVLVTETPDDHRIIDVRPDPRPFAVRPAAMMAVGPSGNAPFRPAGLSPSEAVSLFALVAGQSYIPFAYPDDGCWARAHEMTRLILATGVQPRKVWLYGRLRVDTRNHPSCSVPWRYHVAPTLEVDTGGGVQVQVLDPALFPAPVPQAVWVGVQNDPAAVAHDTAADVYYRNAAGQLRYDPTYTLTQQDLARFRRALALRTAQHGPPPYSHCP